MNEADSDDVRLVAFLDGEISEAEAAEFTRRLAAEPALRQRFDQIRKADAPLRDAFAAMLNDAPMTRLRASLPSAGAPRVAMSDRFALRWAAAALFAVVLFGAGFAAARFTAPAPPDEVAASESWRQAVAEYMTLYTAETFGSAQVTTSNHDFETLGQRVGVSLDRESLNLVGLSLRGSELLQFQGAPLLQIGYVEAQKPVAFCILRDNEADAPLTLFSRAGFVAASWAKGGVGFMLIGQLPPDRTEAYARTLQGRI